MVEHIPHTVPRLAVFTDFDGTLVELAPRPEAVVVTPGLVGELAGLDRRLGHAFAIVTGRSIETVDRFLAPARFAIAGAHGSERRRVDGAPVAASPAVQAAASRLEARLRPLIEGDPRLVLERKPGAVALHYRAAPELAEIARAAVAEAVSAEPHLAVVAGKMVFEARPAGIDKGTAIAAFLSESPFAGRVPVFIGDDVTDEDGFALVQARGGYAIKVGPGPTEARYRLSGVAAVRRLFRALGAAAPVVQNQGRPDFNRPDLNRKESADS